MATLTPTPQPIKIDPLSIKPVPCPGCGEIVGQMVTINGERWLQIGDLFFPRIAFATHKCGATVFYGRKEKVTKIR